MKHASSWAIAAWLLAFAALHAQPAADVRFSQTLEAAERTASGLARLSSDEVAAIDALVRRDTADRLRASAAEKAPTTFVQRLTPSERAAAGVGKLAPAEVPQLEALVDRFESAKLARTLLAPPTFLAPVSRLATSGTKREREIHGSFSLSYGWGSGGYSEKTGSMTLNFEDPARGYAVAVSYSESRVKGGNLYRDAFYEPGRGPLEIAAPLRAP